jgi:hypothetical protein
MDRQRHTKRNRLFVSNDSGENVQNDLVTLDDSAIDHQIACSAEESSRPRLRRAGSSMDSAASSMWDDVFVSVKPKEEFLFLRHVGNTLSLLLKGVTKDFRSNGMPWKGSRCRSLIAGGSGILYALPALVCSSNHPLECVMWIVQAILSVLADYFHIHHDSMWHGVDRFFATFNLIATIVRAGTRLNSRVLPFAILPVGCYVAANRAKTRLDLRAWHWYHFLWHVTSSWLTMLVVYLLYSCPYTDPFFATLCRQQ